MSQSHIVATYLVETALPLEEAVKVITSEQSTGTFTSFPGETEEIKRQHGAKVINIKNMKALTNPSLPGAVVPESSKGVFNRGIVSVSFPYINLGASIPNLLATIAGNLFELEEFSGLRLLDIDLPEEFTHRYSGPQFGIEGTRSLTSVYDRPVIGTIIKPNIGLKEEGYRKVVRELAEAEIDFIKDDEVNGNPPFMPLNTRIKIAMEEIERAADKTGKKAMYAFNITDDIEYLLGHHDTVVEAGGNCVMVSINSVGLSGVSYLRKHSEVPIHGHRNQWGMMTRSPHLGMSFTAYQKLCRLVGVDHLHVNGLNNKFFESNDSIIQSVNDCLNPMFDDYTVMPVLSSKQRASIAPKTLKELKTVDLMHLAGGGIHAHPEGVKAGVESMKQAWDATMKGVALSEYSKDHKELRTALDTFGYS